MKEIGELILKTDGYINTLDDFVNIHKQSLNTLYAAKSLMLSKSWLIELNGNKRPEPYFEHSSSTLTAKQKLITLIESVDEFIKESMLVLGKPEIPQLKAEIILTRLNETKFFLKYELYDIIEDEKKEELLS